MNANNIGGTCSTHGRDEKCLYIVVGKPEMKKLLGEPKRRMEDIRSLINCPFQQILLG
jgi:hypothetical protein